MDVPEPSTVNCKVAPEGRAEVPAELPVEVERGCKVSEDMMRIGNAARCIVLKRYRPLALLAACAACAANAWFTST